MINTTNLFWGLILIAIGVLFLLDNMGHLDAWHYVSTYWPVVLIILGLSMLLNRRRGGGTFIGAEAFEKGNKKKKTDAGKSGGENISLINESNVFGDVQCIIQSEEFRGGAVSTVFGDITIDLLRSKLTGGENTLKINGVFGDATVHIPTEWPVKVTCSTLFGDIKVREYRKSGIGQSTEYISKNYEEVDRKLRVYITQVFGDLKVD